MSREQALNFSWTRIRQLRFIGRRQFSASKSVTVTIGTPGTGYWTATAYHSQLANVVCGIGMNTTNPTVTTANEGEPACK